MLEPKGSTKVRLTNDEMRRLFTWLQLTEKDGRWPDYITIIQGPSNAIGCEVYAFTNQVGREKDGSWVQLHDIKEW